MIVQIQETTLDVFMNGQILRKLLSGRWKEIKNCPNHNKGYNVILIQKRQYMRSAIIAHVYLNYNLSDKLFINHIDCNRLNCSVENLRLIQVKKDKKLSLSRDSNCPVGEPFSNINMVGNPLIP
jgi:hypothetical protein